jgi:phosphate transport system permease protein
MLAWVLFADGALDVHRLDTGERLEHRALVDGAAPTSVALGADRRRLALGFADGTVRLGTIEFRSRFVDDEGQPPEVRALAAGQRASVGPALFERTRERQLRVAELSVALEEPLRVGRAESGSAVAAIDTAELPSGPVIVALTEDGELSIHAVRRTENLLTGEVTASLSTGRLPFDPQAVAEPPRFLKLFGGGDSAVLAWRDGRAIRYDARDFDAPAEAEVVDLAPQAGAELVALEFAAGARTLIAGDSLGRVSGWFRTKPDGATTCDRATLVEAHELRPGSAPVVAIAASPASRTLAVAYADGEARLFFMTDEKELGVAHSARARPATALALAPREGALVAFDEGGLQCWRVESRHPETSFASLLRPVWYEGYPEPEHAWQSSGGTDDFEPKLGLMPLIFGTLKATFYSMLFGVPLALLAAIFSSEFLNPRVRVAVKSTIEIMASLPSVVLGFLAAIVIAPFVQGVVPAVLTTFFALPVVLLLGARAWQLLPHKLTLRWSGWPRFAFIAATIPLGIALAVAAAPALERALFAGSLDEWLRGERGGAVGGWVFLLVPFGAVAAALATSRIVDPWLRRVSTSWTREKCARADLLRFLVTVAAAVAITVVCASALGGLGVDPRGAIVDTYVQRNALVVGFVMGFAIIPLIYTLAEDALSSVPEQLRLASLAAGATQWQTAMRVIVPTAASGLFSAVMIGLGRAVGETMIVLMAAGNTPVMSWNVFSGFRTLSANIAVELPESVKNDTHYRTLFLAALTLFAMTFVVNTAAEVVRQRFRKRAFQL